MAALALMPLLWSCEQDLQEPDDFPQAGELVTLPMTLNAMPEFSNNLGTKAVDENLVSDYKISDYWIIEYNGSGDNAGRVGSPVYYVADPDETDPKVSVMMPEGNEDYTLIILANTHSRGLLSDLSGPKCATLGLMRRYAKPITGLESLYSAGNGTAGDGDIYMNGELPFNKNTDVLNFNLYRNVAKLTLTITNLEDSGVEINSVQIKNVPSAMVYADMMWHRDDKTYSSAAPAFEGLTYLNLELDTSGDGNALIAENSTGRFVYYLPRNCQGTNNSTAHSSKNNNAPQNATYVELLATDTETGMPLRYRFYPGQNMKNDFNIIPNYHYTLPITIKNKGNALMDDRVEDLGRVNLEDANAYIINPLDGDAQAIYSIPIFERINAFWGSVDGKSTSGLNDNVISTSTEWVAEVIWQDQPGGLMEFWDEKKPAGEYSQKVYSGKFDENVQFRVKKNAKGNVLVGVRKAGDQYKGEYLWSWHLWITDYNPDYISSAWVDGQYKYDLPDNVGTVYRYAGGLWESEYVNKYIMDRSIGAMRAVADSDLTKEQFRESTGMFYQWGRKDPFPRDTPLYDGYGTQIHFDGGTFGSPIGRAAGPANLNVVTAHPHLFYTNSSGSDWMSNNNYAGNSWYNPNWHTMVNGKSFFDPCPAGWKLPKHGAFEIFGISGVPNAKEYDSTVSGNGYADYWSFYISDYGKGPTQKFVTTAYRDKGSGGQNHDYRGFIRTTLSPGFTIEYMSDYSGTRNESPAYAFQTRCIKE